MQYNSKPLPTHFVLLLNPHRPWLFKFYYTQIQIQLKITQTQILYFIFLALCSVCLSPSQANNFGKLTLSIFKKQDNGLILKKIGNKWKRRQNQYWRVDFGLYQVSGGGANDGGVSRRVSSSVYSCSHMVPLEFHDSFLFNFLIY